MDLFNQSHVDTKHLMLIYLYLIILYYYDDDNIKKKIEIVKMITTR